MKVSKVGGTKASSGARKVGKATEASGTFADQLKETQSADEVSRTVEGGGVGAVDSILAVQEVPDATDERTRKILHDYGDGLLSRLDELRIGILSGTFPKDRLADLAHQLRQKRRDSQDPRLNEIIEEIELRAEVEIAKLMRPT